MNVSNPNTTLIFTTASLPNGVFTGTVVVMVTAINKYGIGPPSDPAITEIKGTHNVYHLLN